MDSSRQNLFLVVALLGAGFLMLFAFLFVLLFSMMGVESDFSGFGETEGIGILEVTGVIEDSSRVLEDLHDFANDKDVKGIVLRVDSPGGAVAPSQEIYSELMKLRGKKTVVASMGSVAASGGYYISCAAERVFCSPGTLTGSIGVIIQAPYIQELLKLAKIDMTVYKSGEHKDTLSPFRQATPSDVSLIDGVIEDVYEQFLSAVGTARNIETETLRPVADGRLLTGKQAQEAGLVDEMGTMQDAVRYIAEKENLGDDPVLLYPKKKTLNYLEKMFESGARGLANAVSGGWRQSIEYRAGQ